MLIIGEKEAQEGTVSVRTQDSKPVTMSAADFARKLLEEIRTKAVSEV